MIGRMFARESGGNWKSLRFYFIGKACSRVQILYYLRNFVVIIFASFPNLIFRYFYSPNNTLQQYWFVSKIRFSKILQRSFFEITIKRHYFAEQRHSLRYSRRSHDFPL